MRTTKRAEFIINQMRLWAIFIAALATAGDIGSGLTKVSAAPTSYDFAAVAYLDDPAPGGGQFTFDFEPSNINNRGQITFIADLTIGGEGTFFSRAGALKSFAHVGDPAPGGGTFGPAIFGNVGLQGSGEAAFASSLNPFSFPLGLNSGVYRGDTSKGTLEPIVVPNVTPAPAGGVFAGAHWYASLNGRGDVAFAGITSSENGVRVAGKPYSGFADGVYVADKRGTISKSVAAGDSAPGGGTFDTAGAPWINDRGDIAFMGHLAGEEVFLDGLFAGDTQIGFFTGLESVYLGKASAGQLISIAHAGDPAPRGGVFRRASWPVVNNVGQVLFAGDLTPAPDRGQNEGLFLYANGQVIALAWPGDAMPGGGVLSSVSNFNNNHSLDNSGQAAFNAELDTGEQGVYVWSRGQIQLVARTGTSIPGVGTINSVSFFEGFFHESFVGAGVATNDRGQIFFGATLKDGRVVMLIATPHN